MYYWNHKGAPIRRSTEIGGPFSRQNSEKMYMFWRISEMGILEDMEMFNFDRYLRDILK